ncbi:SCO family protein [Pseudovibrio exalbescens]|uniref:SCO family protein n=1 Tax=Pseudovibrio exalbescens TaxID=197461 RepID=UPI0023662825|nr:SCO family protein [Pseudovibrio exalbescens]MDD7911194.1 SCO family protein [Pseudovibrio exalbescens]
MKTSRIIRYTAWAAVAALAFAVAAVSLISWRSDSTIPMAPVANIGGPFTLVNGEGKTVTQEDLKGKPSLMFFGFTYCPDVCPTTLFEMQGWIEELGAEADKLNYVFVSVDPERDTPEVMSDYVSAFDSRITPLTGTPEEIAEVVKSYRVYARRVELDDGDYTMDHTAGVYMMNPAQEFLGTISYGEPHDAAVEKIRKLIEQG